jgi:AraC-like DNA-binding protein
VTRVKPLDFLKNRFDRREIRPGIVEWIYEYSNREPLPVPPYLSSGLELGVQLSGEWLHQGSRTGTHLFTQGMVHTISPGERFWYSFKTSGGTNTLVGFTVYPAEVPELGAAPIAFAQRAPSLDRRLVELAAAIADADRRGERLDPIEVTRELLAFLRSHCEPVQRDDLEAAREEIDATSDRALYLEHVAEVAGMHPTTFSRAFIKRYGLTPTRYRLERRLNAAVRLSWSRPDLSIRAIANEVGFEDPSYFHRVFVQKFGLTPAQIGRRCA